MPICDRCTEGDHDKCMVENDEGDLCSCEECAKEDFEAARDSEVKAAGDPDDKDDGET